MAYSVKNGDTLAEGDNGFAPAVYEVKSLMRTCPMRRLFFIGNKINNTEQSC